MYISSFIVSVIFLIFFCFNSGNAKFTSITLDEFIEGKLSPKSFNGTWLNDNEILYNEVSGNLTIYKINENAKVSLPEASGYEISPTRKYLLIASNKTKLYRHSFLAEYQILNLETYQQSSVIIENSRVHELAKWTSQGNELIVINNNNIFYLPDVQQLNIYHQITIDGGNDVFYGRPNWVYEEEVFSSNIALWFSPSGKKMAFGYFNDAMTNVIDIPLYGIPGGNVSYQYPRPNYINYPKAGKKNPTVKLFYVDLEKVGKSGGRNKSFSEILPPYELLKSEIILAAVVFANETNISATWMNRVQNESYINLYNVEKSSYITALKYTEKRGWLTPGLSPTYSNDGNRFLMILPQMQSDNNEWFHLVMVTIKTTSLMNCNYSNCNPIIRSLTSGTFSITKIVGWDEEKSLVYYLATVAGDPAQLHFYRVSIRENEPKSMCLSCEIKSLNKGLPCLYNGAVLSPSKSRYILTCAGPDVPDISIYNSNDLIKLFTWEDNSNVVKLLKNKTLPRIERLKVPVPGGFHAEVQLFIPQEADLSGSTKYPLIVDVYAGPDSNKITEKFTINWGTYLVTNKSFIYAFIDGRGSKLKSNSMLFSGYRNLGSIEIYDQINVTKYLHNKYSFIDKHKTAIWGWSYGGYAAGMSMALDKYNVFKCGISVAPVTSWNLYDSIYTERYMGLPDDFDNKYGYENGNLINIAKNIKSNRYYLIHGTFDDNVHFQHSLLLAKELERRDILFRQQTYTDESHGINNFLPHLYHSLENFLDECLIKS